MKNKTRLLIIDSFLCTIFSGILIAILSLILVNMSFLNPLKKVIKDFSFLDVYYAENFNDSNGINTDIVLINIEHRDRFELSQMIDKGSVAIDGVSLTIVQVGVSSFQVGIIPHTAKETTLLKKVQGDFVNLETDLLGKYVLRFTQPNKQNNLTTAKTSKLNMDFLTENGFI